jgi:hypothetical protein
MSRDSYVIDIAALRFSFRSIAAVTAMVLAMCGPGLQNVALADVPLDEAPVKPADLPPPPPQAAVQGLPSINAFTVHSEWPKKAYPVPLRKRRYTDDAYYPRDLEGPKYRRPYPEPAYEAKPYYPRAERYEPNGPSPRDYGPDRAPYARRDFAPGAPYAEGPVAPRGAYGVSVGGPRRRDPDPDLPLAPDFELNRHRGFGRLFPVLDPSDPNGRGLPAQGSRLSELRALGERLVEPGEPDDPVGDSDMPAGYTFLGQLVDHDITLDLSTGLDKGVRGDEVANTRTPELDLDNVYGAGPIGSPYLYKVPYLRTGRLIAGEGAYARHDVLRVSPKDRPGPLGGGATAILGDPRDDENLVISQLHAAIVSFHNRTVDVLVSRRFSRHRYKYCGSNVCSIYRLADSLPAPVKSEIFQTARDHVLHYYHRVIAEDLLPWLIGYERTADLLARGRDFYFPRGFRDRDGRLRDPFIPVEFAVAAYRYGHSQVRYAYRLREDYKESLFRGAGHHGVQAFEPITPRQLVDWRYFFEIDETPPPDFNWARRLDPLTTRALHQLHRNRVVGPKDLGSLPARNMQRGRVFYLPGGQTTAEHILPIIERRGALRADYGAGREGWQPFLLPPNKRTQEELGPEETPLWYYVLQEAEVFGISRGVAYTPAYARAFGDGPRYGRGRYERVAYGPGGRGRGGGYGEAGNSLGPVGGTIVGEVLVGLLEHFREKTGKGLNYRPEVRGSVSEYAGGGRRRDGGKPRYLMRNLLIDAGVVEPY